jgi:hypothetical protein
VRLRVAGVREPERPALRRSTTRPRPTTGSTAAAASTRGRPRSSSTATAP